MAAKAILIPPEAEPVTPARVVTVMASLMSGLGIAFRASAMIRKPGRPAMMAPNPYSEAVFMEASREPATAAFTAQMAATLETSVTMGLLAPARVISWDLP